MAGPKRRPSHCKTSVSRMAAFGGGFNGSSRHLIIDPDQEVSAWNGRPGLGLLRDRRESCGSAGRAANAWRTSPVLLEGGTKAVFTGYWPLKGASRRYRAA